PGRISFGGHDISHLPLRERWKLGIAHIPNDRKREGLIPTMTIGENIALTRHATPPFARAGIMSWRTIRRTAKALATQFDVRTPTIDAPISTLSGGNQQKVLLARELAINPP